MKVERDERGRVRRIAKTLATFDCGYVGMTKVPAACAPRATGPRPRRRWPRRGARSTSSACWRASPPPAPPPACRDISGHGWLEVDLPEERDRAEAALRQGPW